MKTQEKKRPMENEVEARRLLAIPMLETRVPHKQIAAHFGVSCRTVRLWSTLYRRGGEEALKVKAAFHRPSHLSKEQKEKLKRLLVDGAVEAGFDTDLWTCPRVQSLITNRFGVLYHVDYLPTLLHDLGFSPQKPEEKARERDEARIRGWICSEWREIKKKHEKLVL